MVAREASSDGAQAQQETVRKEAVEGSKDQRRKEKA
jgi:hypothetical protein